MLRRLSYGQIYLLLGVLLIGAMIASASIGATTFTPLQMFGYIGQAFGWVQGSNQDSLWRNVFLLLRLPRVLMAALAGAVLGVAGTLMQGLFRNPIVEPGLTGTSAGAALGASVLFVFGGHSALTLLTPLGSFGVSVLAFTGSFIATMIVYRLSVSFGKVNVFTLLLSGIAVNAVCAAGTGFLFYIARDPQARDIAFWQLGTFSTATWHGTEMVAVAFVICFLWALRHGKSLNMLMLGEDEATYLGVNPARLILVLIIVNTIMVAVTTAMVGVIAFIGLVIPHILRMVKSADYTFLLPGSALLGALLMEVIDIIARVVIAPAELPIGIITAVVGAPVFLWILLRQQRRGQAAFYG
ncbi:MAG: iron ABC transporter permease [Gammaproteobacteria bacterium]|nr:iron ABC transporter permease [Gammaproteobacteria bacterium]